MICFISYTYMVLKIPPEPISFRRDSLSCHILSDADKFQHKQLFSLVQLNLAAPYFLVVTVLLFDQLEQYFFPFTTLYVLTLT